MPFPPSPARGLVLAGVLVAGAAAPALAADTVVLDIEDADRVLQETERALDETERIRAVLDARVEAVRDEVERVRSEMISAAAKAQALERQLTELESDLGLLNEQRETKSSAFQERRTDLVQALAALQRIGRSPPEGLLLMPAAYDEISRTRLLLAGAVRALDPLARELRDELHDLDRVDRQINEQRERIAVEARKLDDQRAHLKTLLDRKGSLQAETEAQWRGARAMAARLSREAKTMQDLIRQLAIADVDPYASYPSASEAERDKDVAGSDEEPADAEATIDVAAAFDSKQPAETEDASAEPADSGEPIQPAPAKATLASVDRAAGPAGAVRRAEIRTVDDARGLFNFPATGKLVRRFGQTTAPGVTAKGILIETRSAAQIVAPYNGRVAFAGPFRDYGQLLIIAHGEGYHTLLAGLGRIDAKVGQWVSAGEPVGVMMSSADERPNLYVELRRNGRPINPLPWLAAGNTKVQG